MIQVKLGDIFNGNKILMSLTDKEMTVKTGYKLNKIIDECLAEMPKIEKGHSDLVIKYSDGTDTVLPENKEMFIDELNDLLQSEVGIACEKMTIDEISDCKIKPFELKIIAPFI